MIGVLISAVTLASIYMLVAAGLSLQWGGLGFLNLAYGFTFAASGYGAYWAASALAESTLVVLFGGVLVGVLISVLVCLVIVFPLENKPNWPMRSVVAGLAVALIGTNLLLVTWGPDPKPLPPIFGTWSITIAGTPVQASTVMTIVLAGVVIAALLVMLSRSRFGLAVRTLTQNPEGAELVGINRRAVGLQIMIVCGVLVGLSAVLLAPITFVSPQAGLLPLIKGIVVALVGGLGSLRGTAIAALLVGLVEASTAQYLGSQFVLIVLFALIALFLIVRPRGVAGALEEIRA